MAFFQRKQQDAGIKSKILPQALTEKWIHDLNQDYCEIRKTTEHSSIGENIALFCFLDIYLNYEFEDLDLRNKTKEIKKYLNARVFSSTYPQKIFNDIDEFIQTLQE